ncbi:MAG TPA: hypothetical protein VFO34_09495 [Candidatus Acidoferrales bacterium]|nr:hypothetical protein [Candidatus Acidoferrales bacterium]
MEIINWRIADAQREVRQRYIGGFAGQMVSAAVWIVGAALGKWGTPKSSIIAAVVGGFFIFPLTQVLLHFLRPPVKTRNPLNGLGMQVAFVLPFSMLLLIPVGLYRLNLFYPALLILVGAHYLPFVFMYGMRMFVFLAAILMAMGMVIAHYFSTSFSLGAWSGGIALFIFAWIGRSIATREATVQMAPAVERTT